MNTVESGSSRQTRRTHPPITALQRGLTILTEIGQHGADAATLAKTTGINRTTVYRILATLEEAGYLTRSPSSHRYSLSSKVRQLSDGFTDTLWITQIATPALMRLLRDTAWPGSLATFNGRHMVFRETTHRFSSFLVHRPMIGLEAPLATSHGQVFLAFSAESVRRPLLETLVADWHDCGFGRTSADKMERHLQAVRERGYAVATGSLVPEVGGVAMPVRRGNQVFAALNVVATSAVIGSPVMLRKLQERLAEEIRTIEQEIERAWL